MTGAQNITAVLSETMATEDSVHLLGESLPLSPVCAPLLIKHAERCHLLPAADATLIGVAIGLALAGKKPVVELAGPEALWGAIQQIGQETSAFSDEFGITMIVRVPLGPAAMDPSGMLADLKHIRVVSPAEPADAGSLIESALGSNGVTIVLEPLSVLGTSGGTSGTDLNARIIEEGDHLTLLAWGSGVQEAKKAAKTLRKEGISSEIVDLRVLAPLDTETVGKSIKKTGRVIMVGGSGTMMNSTINAAFLRLESPPVQVEQSTTAIVSQARVATQY